MKKLVCLTGVAVGLFAAGTAAAGSGPLPVSYSFTDTTDCPGIAIDITGVGQRVVTDRDGLHVVHFSITETWTANGKTLTNHEGFTATFSSDTGTYTGVVNSITAPGTGPLLKDAGRVIYDANGDPISAAGSSSSGSGLENVCAYFADP